VERLARAGRALVQGMQQQGGAPSWVEAERRSIEAQVGRGDWAAARDALEQACTRLAATAPPAATVPWRAYLLERQVRRKRLEPLFAKDKPNLFGLAETANRARALVDEGRPAEALPLIAELEAVVARFRD